MCAIRGYRAAAWEDMRQGREARKGTTRAVSPRQKSMCAHGQKSMCAHGQKSMCVCGRLQHCQRAGTSCVVLRCCVCSGVSVSRACLHVCLACCRRVGPSVSMVVWFFRPPPMSPPSLPRRARPHPTLALSPQSFHQRNTPLGARNILSVEEQYEKLKDGTMD